VADEADPKLNPEFPEEEPEVDVLFRTEMHVRNFVLGYWKHALSALGVFLLGALVLGLYRSYIEGAVRESSAAISDIDQGLPQPDQAALYGLAPVDDISDPEIAQALTDAAGGYEEIANGAIKAASAEAWLKAADTWRRAGDDARARAAYEVLLERGAGGLFTAAARNGLAALDLEAGDAAAAAAHLRALADDDQGILAERALLDMARSEIAQGNRDKARELIAELRLRFPKSPRAADAAALEAELQPAAMAPPEGGGAEGAPTPGPEGQGAGAGG